MSGIVGILHLDGRPAAAAELRRAAGPIAHRGPDGVALYTAGPAGLGGLLMHVTPESLFEEPLLVGGDGGLVLAADVRLDNRAELLGALGLAPRPGRPVTDAELVLAAYERWGEGCPERLLGAFAFAVWDEQERRLFLARDHFGVKPLFYAHVPGRVFAFASEIKALLEVEGVSDALDELEVASHLIAPVREDFERTYYRDIRSLTPAHAISVSTISVSGGHVRARRYYALDPEREVRLSSDEAYAEAFREVFEEAVRCRLRSAFPVGSMMSGGLDSSSIAVVAAQLRGGDLPTFSAVFPEEPRSDESSYMRAVVEKYGLPWHRFEATGVSPLGDLDRIHWYLDKPLVGGNFYVNWNLYQTAGAQGTRVVLDGFDGDTTISHGIGYLHELRAQRRILTLAREVKAYSDVIGMDWKRAVWGWTQDLVMQRTGLGHVRRAGAAARDRFRPARVPAPAALPTWRRLMRDDFAQRIEEALVEPPGVPTTEREHHFGLIDRPLMSQVNETLNIAAAAAGGESRLPFYDRRLVEFCLALPPQQKLKGGWSRFILRNAMGGLLPEEVRWRGGKTSLEPSFNRGIRLYEDERIRDIARDFGPAAEYFDAAALRDYGGRYLEGALPVEDELFFWRAFSLSLWLRREPNLDATTSQSRLLNEVEVKAPVTE